MKKLLPLPLHLLPSSLTSTNESSIVLSTFDPRLLSSNNTEDNNTTTMIVPTTSTLILRRTPLRTTLRSLAMKIREEITPLPPNFSMDAIAPPTYVGSPSEPDVDPMALKRKPVTAAYAVDVEKKMLSALDSAAIGGGGVQHGTLGKITGDVSTIPLEYLAVLRPASEGAAALREMKVGGGGTLLVYGASRPAGMVSEH
jgi:hypothetical protein